MKTVSEVSFKDENFKKLLLDLKIDSVLEITELYCNDSNLVCIDEIK